MASTTGVVDAMRQLRALQSQAAMHGGALIGAALRSCELDARMIHHGASTAANELIRNAGDNRCRAHADAICAATQAVYCSHAPARP
ncbi:hypothetical protein XarbCFBP8147_04030 [Xanthomonas arboricola]|nr:hypothetical protein XarbCFBP8147_04030 [Xanthomonas arboricola]